MLVACSFVSSPYGAYSLMVRKNAANHVHFSFGMFKFNEKYRFWPFSFSEPYQADWVIFLACKYLCLTVYDFNSPNPND